MITLKEIAHICGVSTSTVSNILNGKHNVSEETRQKVLKVIKDTQYQPNSIAQGLRNQKTRLIGIIAEDVSIFTTPAIIESIMGYYETTKYKFVLENLQLYGRWKDTWYDDKEKYFSVLQPALQELLSIKVDGIIYIAGHARIINCFSNDFQVPAVMTYAYSGSEKFPSVVLDDEKGGYDMTKYLISMGHQRIGLIGGRPDNIHTQKRLQGYQKALFESGVLFDPDLIRYGSWERESGYQEAKNLIGKNVTAIFCLCDRMAGGAYDYLLEHHFSIGKDISVSGYDNQIISEYMGPALTTVNLPLSQIGSRAAEILLTLMESGESDTASLNIPTETRFPCSLVIRDSVKNIRENIGKT